MLLVLTGLGLKVTGANPLAGIELANTLFLLAVVFFSLGMGVSISTCKQLCAQIAVLDAQKLDTLLTNSQLRAVQPNRSLTSAWRRRGVTREDAPLIRTR